MTKKEWALQQSERIVWMSQQPVGAIKQSFINDEAIRVMRENRDIPVVAKALDIIEPHLTFSNAMVDGKFVGRKRPEREDNFDIREIMAVVS